MSKINICKPCLIFSKGRKYSKNTDILIFLQDYDNHKPREVVGDFVRTRLVNDSSGDHDHELSYHTLLYLISYLQRFAAPETVQKTKMDDNNLATIWAPNILRCPSKDQIVMIQNVHKEKAFIKNLIKWLDT